VNRKESTKRKGSGGARSNAGRKPIPQEERKVGVWLLFQNKEIARVGGADALKDLCYNAIKEAPSVVAGA
jgi:hypothetical protein